MRIDSRLRSLEKVLGPPSKARCPYCGGVDLAKGCGIAWPCAVILPAREEGRILFCCKWCGACYDARHAERSDGYWELTEARRGETLV